jgi:hypothetical protein
MRRESEEPVRQLRAKVAEERAMLENLARKFNQPSVKESVEQALLDLGDVETLFLSTLDQGSRTAHEEAALIRNAEAPLQVAISKRRRLQKRLGDVWR